MEESTENVSRKPSAIRVSDPRTASTACRCLEAGPRAPDIDTPRYIGVDETEGRFADVTLERCTRCECLWLRYQVEYEAFAKSGRWAAAPIAEDAATAMTPELAAGYFDSAAWYIYGGSY